MADHIRRNDTPGNTEHAGALAQPAITRRTSVIIRFYINPRARSDFDTFNFKIICMGILRKSISFNYIFAVKFWVWPTEQ